MIYEYCKCIQYYVGTVERKSNHRLSAVPARNNDLREEANGDGRRRQAERRAGRRNFCRNHGHGPSPR